ncbi:hypothetical protein KIN20_036927 [Parelaphostrongylus tenuis]|uniref:Uncharacterized protein n=1 Tax=Parelaphostrongylus tenuis TaxID=148309 RepID=A0AAD5WM18_PARTN|nr:hypothetical protein KIN20_036927 [Parelaphostrongylus tenuis]
MNAECQTLTVSTRTFNVTGFTTLPVNMVYTSAMNAARVPGIATSQEGARGSVSRLVMQTVFDVLESNGRSAFLPDAVISTILSQLTLNITYEPMLCQAVILNLAADGVDEKRPQNCIIVSNTVTGICTKMKNNARPMSCDTTMPSTIAAIPGAHLTKSGTLSTTNIWRIGRE